MASQCPHCQQEAISTGRKLTLGPMRVVACQSCGKSVRLDNREWIAFAPALLGLLWWIAGRETGTGGAGLALGIGVYAVLHAVWVGFVPAE